MVSQYQVVTVDCDEFAALIREKKNSVVNSLVLKDMIGCHQQLTPYQSSQSEPNCRAQLRPSCASTSASSSSYSPLFRCLQLHVPSFSSSTFDLLISIYFHFSGFSILILTPLSSISHFLSSLAHLFFLSLSSEASFTPVVCFPCSRHKTVALYSNVKNFNPSSLVQGRDKQRYSTAAVVN